MRAIINSLYTSISINSLCVIVFVCTGFNSHAQIKEISRRWTSFAQSVDASFLKKKVKFKVTASVKAIVEDTTSSSGLWARVDNKEEENGFYSGMQDRPIRLNEWRTYVIEGTMDEHADKIFFGGWCEKNGKFYFDNFEFYVENDAGKFEKVKIDNPSFEMGVAQHTIPNWIEGNRTAKQVRIKEFSISSSTDCADGKYSLLIEGRGIKNDSSGFIGPDKGFSPQIGTLVSMLNNLSARVEQCVNLLNLKETDHLLDTKANSIGALIMHLAAAEAYYQVYTFEKREFNDEEKKKWDVALNLGDEARKQLKGHEIEYYLNIYKEVRKKTIEELSKRNDQWLAEVSLGLDLNNHFCWFHVMEHQSSHLGQILLLKKRLPKREEPKPEVKIDYDH